MELFKKILIGVIFYFIFSIFFILFLNKIMILDHNLFFIINSISNPFLDSFFILITYLGSSVFWVLMILLFWMEKQKKVSIYLIFAFIIDSISSIFLKYLFIRPRPYESLSNLKILDFEIEVGPSFPSAHTERAFSGAIILSSIYKKFRIIFFILAFLVGLSRIYIGMHYPIDTLVGAINGILFGLITLTFPIKTLQKKLEKI